MKKSILLIPAFLGLLVACKEAPKKECETTNSCCHHKTVDASDDNAYIAGLKSDIMALHDEVMPKDPYLYELRGQLEVSEDSVQAVLDSVKLAQLAMHTWMREYQASHDNADTAYFLSEL